jgi:hypothetical protein
MTHDYHDEMPGFSADQLMVDGCGECEYRSAQPGHGIAELDPQRFRSAWLRAAILHKRGLATVSRTERPLLDVLWQVQLQFERISGVPIGAWPIGIREVVLAGDQDG